MVAHSSPAYPHLACLMEELEGSPTIGTGERPGHLVNAWVALQLPDSEMRRELRYALSLGTGGLVHLTHGFQEKAPL